MTSSPSDDDSLLRTPPRQQQIHGSWDEDCNSDSSTRKIWRTLSHRHSEWNNSGSCTPMTTRPHFVRYERSRTLSPPRGLRRIRSRSMGSETALDAERASLLALPSLDEPKTYDSISAAAVEPPPEEIERSADDADKYADETNPLWVCMVYGMINASIVLPVLMSFGSIIYRHEAFAPYMPILIKLTVISGIVHQFCFSTFSSLPFAVGQVQDAGLIFLSSMATSMVNQCQEKNHSSETMLATVLVGLSLATAILGVGLIIIGYLQLGQYVQLLPTSVVGGYLAYIGWFCGISGIMLMSGTSEVSFSNIWENMTFIIPGLLGGVSIYLLVSKLQHMAVLPVSIITILVIFYIVLFCTGTSITEATDAGWIRKMQNAPPLFQTWDFFQLDLVDWSILPSLTFSEISMIVVVALSSSLDVAAIEIELKRPLDYDRELKTVGLSNLISGCCGGYTGSYIFSQSIFSLRAGIRSRKAGICLAMFEAIILLSPFPILSFIPNFFYGSLLILICTDLMYEWLWDVRHRVSTMEHVICLGTFGLIHLFSVEYGIMAGIALHILCEKLGLDVGDSKFHGDSDIVPTAAQDDATTIVLDTKE